MTEFLIIRLSAELGGTLLNKLAWRHCSAHFIQFPYEGYGLFLKSHGIWNGDLHNPDLFPENLLPEVVYL